MTKVPEWLAQRAAISPDRLALVWGKDQHWTYRELNERVVATANCLKKIGVRPGERIALLATSSTDAVQIIHSLPRVGAVLVPLNVRLTAKEIYRQISDADVAALVYDEGNREIMASLQIMLPQLPIFPLADLTKGADSDSEIETEPVRLDLSSTHTIIYTSGTAGVPKGVVLSFDNHLWSAIGSAFNIGLSSSDRWLLCLPLFHVGGLAILLRSIIYGTAVVLQESFDPATVNRSIDKDGITITSVVGAMLQRMLEERGSRPYPSSIRCALVGGGPVPRSVLKECSRLQFPAVPTYGLTEAASQVATMVPGKVLHKLGSSGKALLPTEVQIEDADGRHLLPGQEGEVVVRGPSVTKGYFNKLRESRHLLRKGWLHTGDIGYLDDDGYLYVNGRCDDMVISGGEKIHLTEVEEVLRDHPHVVDAGAIGLHNLRWGQTVGAVVVLRDGSGTKEGELIEFCRNRLASYKLPRQLFVVKNLPRNAAGKLIRNDIKELVNWARE